MSHPFRRRLKLSLIAGLLFLCGCNLLAPSPSTTSDFLPHSTSPTVSYDGNGNTGGSAPTDSSSPYVSGSAVTVIGNTGSLTKTNYTFVGWNTVSDGSGTNYAAGNSFTMGAANVVLYAKWTLVYTVTYNGNGNTGGSAPTDSSSPYLSGSTVTVLGITDSLTHTRYTFTGWNTASDGSGTSYSAGNTFTLGAANTVLYAQWMTYAYVSHSSGSLYQCAVNSDGTFDGTSCSSAGVSGTPTGNAFATSSGGMNHFYYLTQGGGTNLVHICNYNTTGGAISGCAITPSSGAPGWSSPFMIQFATFNGTQYAYVTDTSHVYLCTMNNDGTFTDAGCSATPAVGEPGWSPRFVAFATVSGTQYAFVSSSNKLYTCTLNANGTFTNSSCTVSLTLGMGYLTGALASASIGGSQYLYAPFTNGGTRDVYEFPINNDGSLGAQTTMASPGGGWGSFFNMIFQTINGTQYAYLATQGGRLVNCTLNTTNGNFTACAQTPSSNAPNWFPTGISFSP